jgi:hypothetical protein
MALYFTLKFTASNVENHWFEKDCIDINKAKVLRKFPIFCLNFIITHMAYNCGNQVFLEISCHGGIYLSIFLITKNHGKCKWWKF